MANAQESAKKTLADDARLDREAAKTLLSTVQAAFRLPDLSQRRELKKEALLVRFEALANTVCDADPTEPIFTGDIEAISFYADLVAFISSKKPIVESGEKDVGELNGKLTRATEKALRLESVEKELTEAGKQTHSRTW